MEPHPIIGTNYRISELHAAIGLAQFRKLPHILECQRKNKLKLEQTVSKFSQISLRKTPDKKGDSATFLDFFLPDEATTRKVLKSFDKHGVGYAYWYDNNYHYFRNWEHIKQMKTAAKLAIKLFKAPQDYSTIRFPQSDNIISRLISIQIRITWTDEELRNLSQKIENALTEVF
jgi:8-amino-3,8-dideoxy-alpha-D-manno-octulosonate transaminase